MLKLFCTTCAMVIALSPQTIAATTATSIVKGEQAVQHGGGCRKASPPGQCCHAGSKPYHCHK